MNKQKTISRYMSDMARKYSDSLTPEQRKARASKAALAMWNKKKEVINHDK